MMLVSSLGENVLLCDRLLGERLRQTELREAVAEETACLVVFDVPGGLQACLPVLSEFGAKVSPRYMDKFYICTAGTNSADRQVLLDQFFGLIADDYESLVSLSRNQENITNLLRFIADELGPFDRHVVMDFGCGTGLSLDVAQKLGVNLVGVDSCPTMRARAVARGMVVWSPSDLSKQPIGSIDAAFASYVLHLLPDMDALHELWEHLRVGGVFVANFHKNAGCDMISDSMVRMGACVDELSGPEGMAHHGAYRRFRKQE